MIAGAFDDAQLPIASGEEHVRAKFEEMLRAGTITKAACRICGSTAFHYETGRTTFRTMDEANDALMDTERANIESGNLLELLNQLGKRG